MREWFRPNPVSVPHLEERRRREQEENWHAEIGLFRLRLDKASQREFDDQVVTLVELLNLPSGVAELEIGQAWMEAKYPASHRVAQLMGRPQILTRAAITDIITEIKDLAGSEHVSSTPHSTSLRGVRNKGGRQEWSGKYDSPQSFINAAHQELLRRIKDSLPVTQIAIGKDLFKWDDDETNKQDMQRYIRNCSRSNPNYPFHDYPSFRDYLKTL